MLSYAADLRYQSRGGNTTINDVRCADRLKEFGVLERSSGDDGRKSREFRKLDSWTIDATRKFLFRLVSMLSQLTILANGTGSTKDKNGISTILSFAFGSYRRDQSKTSRLFIVKTDVRCREGDGQSSRFIVRNIGRNLTDIHMSDFSRKEGRWSTFATVEAKASAYCWNPP